MSVTNSTLSQPYPTEVSLNVKPCPASGDGVHSWLFYAACRAVEKGMTDEQAIKVIERMMTRPPNPASEIEDALRSAGGGPRSSAIQWPHVNHEQIEAIAHDPRDILNLWKSWRSSTGTGSHTEEIIDRLFPGNPWLCVGKSNRSFCTRRREDWRTHLNAHSLIVPSPMTSETGLTKSGHRSYHTLANTGRRRFLIVEADRGPLEQQAAVIWHLATIGLLAIVVYSGSKSLHGWLFCEGTSEDNLLKFMRYAVSLGADQRMWLRSQFCRMPDGFRSDGKSSNALALCGWDGIPPGQQALLYFNPQAIQ